MCSTVLRVDGRAHLVEETAMNTWIRFLAVLPPASLGGLMSTMSNAENLHAEWLLAYREAARVEGQARDFDFLRGRWLVENRRLVERLHGSHQWQEFRAQSTCYPLPGGIGNRDEFRTDFWPGYVGMSLRFFDARTGQWSIYWIDNRSGTLQPPVTGGFVGDVGVFEGTDVFEGRPIRVRYTWSHVAGATPRWEQAFSADDGKTWETNWVMNFTRLDTTAY
jgi:hypothetical protein